VNSSDTKSVGEVAPNNALERTREG
jgi:hypothetical protein